MNHCSQQQYGSYKDYTEPKKPDAEDCMLCDSMHMKFTNRHNSFMWQKAEWQGSKADWELGQGWGRCGGPWKLTLKGHKGTSVVVKKKKKRKKKHLFYLDMGDGDPGTFI